MEKKRNIIQVYAIIVNVVAIITFIIALANLVSAMIDRDNPLYTSSYNDSDLSSFEKYKLDVLNSTEKDAVYIPDDAAILKMYEDAKIQKINKVEHQSYRTIMVSSLVIAFCVILFLFHWWLIRKYS
jgi:flagellar biogenesis protein FliO